MRVKRLNVKWSKSLTLEYDAVSVLLEPISNASPDDDGDEDDDDDDDDDCDDDDVGDVDNILGKCT